MPAVVNDGCEKPVVLQKVRMPVFHPKSTKFDVQKWKPSI